MLVFCSTFSDTDFNYEIRVSMALPFCCPSSIDRELYVNVHYNDDCAHTNHVHFSRCYFQLKIKISCLAT